jgi:hypothetical protein
MSGFIKRFLLSIVASKLERRAHRHGHNPAVDGLLREVDHRLNRRRRGYGHHGSYGYHGHYRHHGHYRRRRW